MDESQFLEQIRQIFQAIENALEAAAADVECTRSENRLTLQFDDGTKIIINSQQALHELWVATPSGGFHYRHDGSGWRDTRSGGEFFAALTQSVSTQARQDITLRADC